jgi:hypothetical protein
MKGGMSSCFIRFHLANRPLMSGMRKGDQQCLRTSQQTRFG